jgi:hypothetical protein
MLTVSSAAWDTSATIPVCGALHICGVRGYAPSQHVTRPQIHQPRRDTDLDEHILALIDSFQVIERAGHHISPNFYGLLQTHGPEQPAILLFLPHGSGYLRCAGLLPSGDTQ